MATQPPRAMACLSLSVTPGHFGLFEVFKKLLLRENLTICKGQKMIMTSQGYQIIDLNFGYQRTQQDALVS